MGGCGSTRWGGTPTRYVVEQCHSISAHALSGDMAAVAGRIGVWSWPSFLVSYEVLRTDAGYRMFLRSLGDDGAVAQTVLLTATRPHYGGARWWFRCPGCRRRVRDLHLPRRAYRFACRQCHNLSYESAQETRSGIVAAIWTRVARAGNMTRGAARRFERARIGGNVHVPRRIGQGLVAAAPVTQAHPQRAG